MQLKKSLHSLGRDEYKRVCAERKRIKLDKTKAQFEIVPQPLQLQWSPSVFGRATRNAPPYAPRPAIPYAYPHFPAFDTPSVVPYFDNVNRYCSGCILTHLINTRHGCVVCGVPLCSDCSGAHTCATPPLNDFCSRWGRMAIHDEWPAWRDARFHKKFQTDIMRLISTQDEDSIYDNMTEDPLICKPGNMNSLIKRMAGPDERVGRVSVVAQTSSDIIDMVPALANFAADRIRTALMGRGEEGATYKQGHVLVMKQCYLSGRPASRFSRHGRQIFVGCCQNLMDPASEFVHTVDFHMRQSRGAPSVLAQAPQLNHSEIKCLDEIVILLENHLITVAVIETVTAGTVEQLGHAFLLELRKLLSANHAILIVDDTLMSIRCGRYFSHQLFAGFQPDLVMVGKHWGVAMLISFMDDEMTNTHIPSIAGSLTCQISPLALRKAVHIVTLMVEYALDKACQAIEKLFLDVLQGPVWREGDGAFLNCMGAIASTNLRMSPETMETVLYNRLIPRFTVPLDLLH
jgi:hypothetical protein